MVGRRDLKVQHYNQMFMGRYFIDCIKLRTVGVCQTLLRHQRQDCDRIPQPREQRSRKSRLFRILEQKGNNIHNAYRGHNWILIPYPLVSFVVVNVLRLEIRR